MKPGEVAARFKALEDANRDLAVQKGKDEQAFTDYKNSVDDRIKIVEEALSEDVAVPTI